MKPSHKASQFTESVIREMTRLNQQFGGVNLSQGFPDFPAPAILTDAACRAIQADVNQYAVTWGTKAFREAIAASFPPGTSVSDPSGGFLLWVEMPAGIDALQLQAEAGRRGIAIAPGPIFAAGDRFKSCIRVNCGFPWSAAMAGAVHTLGELAVRLDTRRR